MIWYLNKIQYPIYNLGPGKRLGIWVQGCSIHCKGCINKSLWNNEKGKKLPVLAVYEIVNQLCETYDGITITGGEPFEQYPQLMAFCMLLKRKTNLNILCYSGYYLSELEIKFPDKTFYKCLDFLVDGRYEQKKPTDNSIKGSENQDIYTFSEGKAVKIELENSSKKWSIKCEDDLIYMAGVPKQIAMIRLFKNLEEINLKSDFL
jgi:anaerobic ribonucleoside-triphosphate reductase activating protein